MLFEDLRYVIHTGHIWFPESSVHELAILYGGLPVSIAQSLHEIEVQDGAILRISAASQVHEEREAGALDGAAASWTGIQLGKGDFAEGCSAVHTFVSVDLTYAEHEAAAQQQGAHIASMTNEEENSQMVALCGGRVFWCGAKRKGNGNGPGSEHWEWADASPWAFTKWAAGEPNNAGGREDRVQVYANGEWNDIHAGWRGPAVYKMEGMHHTGCDNMTGEVHAF